MSSAGLMRAVVSRGRMMVACFPAIVATFQVDAQGTGGTDAPAASRSLIVSPSISVGETLTDNSRLSGGGGRAEAITQISPAIHVVSNGARVKGFLDYSMNGLVYARSSGSNEIQNLLNGSGQIEAIDNWAFVDVNASISQQLLSAFGTRSADSTSIDSNRTEVRTYSVSPNVRGVMSGIATTYEARLTYGATNSAAKT